MSAHQPNILIVDDHPDNLRTLSGILQNTGHKVRKAISGELAIETIGSQAPDVILLDIRMPYMDGYEVCKILKQSEQTRDIPIIFISALSEVADKVKAFELGGADYITKPFHAEEVLARVNYQITLRQQQQQLTELYQQVQSLNRNLEQQVEERTHELQQALAELQRFNQLKDEFLSAISHELRTPLANIRMVLDLLMNDADSGHDPAPTSMGDQASTSRVPEYFKILRTECDRELQLVQDLLDLQHLAADTHPFNRLSINLYDWVAHSLEVVEPRIQARQQSLMLHLASDLPVLETDLFSLNRILMELLNNACEYTPSGGTITLTVKTDNKFIYIQVSNSGVDIPPDELPRVFDKFYRVTGHDPWQHGGIGLGLALVQKLVEHLKGAIEVTSANNITCFTVRLPIAADPLPAL